MPDQFVLDLGLMLMYLSSWTERAADAQRFWKNFDFDLLNALEDQDLIQQSRTAKSAYLTDEGVRRARELIERYQSLASAAAPTIVRLSTGADHESHFEDHEPEYEPRGDHSESAELIPGSGMLVRRFESDRANPWHHAPGRYAVFTLRGAVDIEIGDGSTRRIGPGQVLIAEDLAGQGHQTREVGPESRVSVFVPLP
jgi:hypothetical protein